MEGHFQAMDAVTLHGGNVERDRAIEGLFELKAALAVKILKFWLKAGSINFGTHRTFN